MHVLRPIDYLKITQIQAAIADLSLAIEHIIAVLHRTDDRDHLIN